MNETQPRLIHGPEAWYGKDLEASERWRFCFCDEELAELDEAVARAREKGLAWQDLTRSNFPLPLNRVLFDQIAMELEEGSGIANIKGIPVWKYDNDDINRLWYGIALNIGTPIYQNYQGELLRDIMDEKTDTDADNSNRFFARDGSVFYSSRARTASNKPLRFHTDRCDVVGLLCLHPAVVGGLSQIASSVTISNEIIHREPELAALLWDVVYRSRHGEEKDGRLQKYGIPVFGQRDGKFTSHYSRTYVEAAQELEDVPVMTSQQWRALDLLAEIAGIVCMEMKFEPGDIQFLNNHITYHARTAYEDGAKARCLKRIWLSMPNSRALPEDHMVLWQNVAAGGIRGGIVQS